MSCNVLNLLRDSKPFSTRRKLKPGSLESRPIISSSSKFLDRGSIIEIDGLEALIMTLRHDGFRLIGPTVRDGAILYEDIETADDLPIGWTDDQDAGRYRLRRRDDQARFGYVVGPHALKRFLHPPVQQIWRAVKDGDDYAFKSVTMSERPFAFIGVRPCDIRAMMIQDRVFEGGAYADTHYQARCTGAFIVAVNCTEAAPTCFCTSMGSGTTAERDPAGDHRFLVEVGSLRSSLFA